MTLDAGSNGAIATAHGDGAASTEPVLSDPAPSARLKRAVGRLRTGHPELSAAEGLWGWQKLALLLLSAGAALVLVSGEATPLLAMVLAVPFLLALALRVYAIRLLLKAPPSRGPAIGPPDPLAGDCDLPLYTVLVPLLREANIADMLVRSLRRLDYPVERLQILLIVERFDTATHMALVATGLPAHMRIVVVPDGEPRTKPRALNYALTFAEGDYVVVYDAEDEPEPDQLRRALVLLRSEPDRIGCVQARLNVYNAGTSWFTRQFAIEYSCLFDALLPALERLDLPVPLGGTSNHFPRRVLEEVGGWDPYNVTEDADLGIRLVRKGRRIAVLRSTTWEEAPPTWAVWFPQRTRWLKGWMQTMIVHTRQPACLAAELGPWRTAGLVLLMGGLIVSALLHPWFYLAICIGWWQGGLYWPTTTLQSVLLGIALFNLIAGYAAAMVLGVFAVHARGFSGLGRQTLWVVVYWLAISIAAHRALWQLVRAPHLWEKTPHTSRGGRPGA